MLYATASHDHRLTAGLRVDWRTAAKLREELDDDG